MQPICANETESGASMPEIRQEACRDACRAFKRTAGYRLTILRFASFRLFVFSSFRLFVFSSFRLFRFFVSSFLRFFRRAHEWSCLGAHAVRFFSVGRHAQARKKHRYGCQQLGLCKDCARCNIRHETSGKMRCKKTAEGGACKTTNPQIRKSMPLRPFCTRFSSVLFLLCSRVFYLIVYLKLRVNPGAGKR